MPVLYINFICPRYHSLSIADDNATSSEVLTTSESAPCRWTRSILHRVWPWQAAFITHFTQSPLSYVLVAIRGWVLDTTFCKFVVCIGIPVPSSRAGNVIRPEPRWGDYRKAILRRYRFILGYCTVLLTYARCSQFVIDHLTDTSLSTTGYAINNIPPNSFLYLTTLYCIISAGFSFLHGLMNSCYLYTMEREHARSLFFSVCGTILCVLC
jgi:hypothetical protein